jgi:hypothetical protein
VKNLLKFGLYHTTEGEVFGKSFEFIFSHYSKCFISFENVFLRPLHP